jgi:hypothetical protein
MAIQLSLSQLLQAVPLESWKQRIEDIAKGVGLKTENWAAGGFTRILIALFAPLHTTNGDAVRIIAASHFLDLAEGAWLTALAKQVYNVDRIEATYAAAPQAITLTNTGNKYFEFDPLDIVFKKPSNDRSYRNSSGGVLPPGGTLVVDVIADQPGSDSNAAVGTITELTTTLLGVTCTNTVALIGVDEQKDPELRQLCRDSVAARSIGGVKRAYFYYAKTTRRTNGTPVGVTRVRIPPAVGDGTGAVYVASASGALTSPDVDFVQASFDENVTHYGFDATAISAANKSITAPCTIWIPSSLGLTEEQAQLKVYDALSAYITGVDIGGVVIAPTAGRIYWRKLIEIITAAVPGALKAQLTSETDIAIAGNEVPVWAGELDDTIVNLVT